LLIPPYWDVFRTFYVLPEEVSSNDFCLQGFARHSSILLFTPLKLALFIVNQKLGLFCPTPRLSPNWGEELGRSVVFLRLPFQQFMAVGDKLYPTLVFTCYLRSIQGISPACMGLHTFPVLIQPILFHYR